MEDEIDELIVQLQTKISKQLEDMYLPIIKALEDVESLPRTVCLVYMTEQHDGGQASYCEVYKDEETAVKSLLSRGFKCQGGSYLENYTLDEFSWAEIRANVKVKTDE